MAADRYVFFTEFYKNFYNTDQLLGKRVSEEVVKASWNIAVGASAIASLACVPTWHEDFRKDLERVDVPTLVSSTATKTALFRSLRPVPAPPK